MVTIILLVLGAFSVFGTLGDYLNFPVYLNQVLAEVHSQMPEFPAVTYTDTGLARPLGMVIITLEGLILGLIVWWTIRRMSAGKLAFWVPLVGWLLNGVVVGVGEMVCLLSDPVVLNAFMSLATSLQTTAPTISPAATPVDSASPIA